jgi:hypothetical protein
MNIVSLIETPDSRSMDTRVVLDLGKGFMENQMEFQNKHNKLKKENQDFQKLKIQSRMKIRITVIIIYKEKFDRNTLKELATSHIILILIYYMVIL